MYVGLETFRISFSTFLCVGSRALNLGPQAQHQVSLPSEPSPQPLILVIVPLLQHSHLLVSWPLNNLVCLPPSPKKEVFIYFYVFACVYVCVPGTGLVLVEVRGGCGTPETGIIGTCELLCWCWEPKLGHHRSRLYSPHCRNETA